MAAEWLAGWWAWIVVATLQASALLAAVWLVDRLARRSAWPQLLSALWWLGLARLALPDQLGSPWSVTTAVGESAGALASRVPTASVLEAAFATWALGAAVVLSARALRRRALRRAIEPCQLPQRWSRALSRARARSGRRTAPRVAVLASLRGPAVTGLLRPTLLLPPDALRRAPSVSDEHALLHELTHLRRGDLWLDEVCALARAAFWFNPLVWQAAQRIHALSELACDRTVAAALGPRASEYRATLLSAAQELLSPRATPPVRAFLGPRAQILARLEQLERSSRAPLSAIRAASAIATGLIAACVLPMAPSAKSLREQALAVLAAEQRGELQSCFALRAAAQVLAADPHTTPQSK